MNEGTTGKRKKQTLRINMNDELHLYSLAKKKGEKYFSFENDALRQIKSTYS